MLPNNALATTGLALRAKPTEKSTPWARITGANVNLRGRRTDSFWAYAAQATPYIEGAEDLSYMELIQYWAFEFLMHMHVSTIDEEKLRSGDTYFSMLDSK